MSKLIIPPEISSVAHVLENAGFEAYLVGGCTRDLLSGRTPKDWDFTTNANPTEIMGLFPHTFYENDFGTVGVVNDDIPLDDVSRLTLRVVEITPYRTETTYSNFRHPDSVEFSKNLYDDLQRRDFTMNAIAYSVTKDEIVDPYNGVSDIQNKIIRAVGNPHTRFTEDALRVMRAVRFVAQLGYNIEEETLNAVVKHAPLVEKIAMERVKDEFSKLIMSAQPKEGLELLYRVNILSYICPNLIEGFGCAQNKNHVHDVWNHNLLALQHAADKNWPLHIRLASLFHDIGKPHSRRWSDDKKDWTFYGHEVVGMKMVSKIMERLRFSRETSDKVVTLVRYHMFFSDIETITLSAVRRIVANVGPELVWDLMNVRSCDRIGMGRPMETPYRLRKYHSMIEEAMRAPVSVKMLKIDGIKIMEVLGEPPSRRIGAILHALFDEVLEDPDKNTEEELISLTKKYAELPEEALILKGEEGRATKNKEEEKELKEIRNKYHVK
jgi:tRNA nucleotidyltransferase (CCA-adding enzyme)